MDESKAANENKKLRDGGIIIKICLSYKKNNFGNKAEPFRDPSKT